MDMISRQAAIEPKAISEWKKEFREYVDSLDITRDDWKGIIEYIDEIPSAQPERMTNRQWIDFLSVQFDISRTSAKEMLHGMMQWKKEDNFKKMFNGGKT